MIMTSRLKLKKHSFADSVTKVCFAIFYKIKKSDKNQTKMLVFFVLKQKIIIFASIIYTIQT